MGASPQGAQSLGTSFTFPCSSFPGVAYTSECFPCKPGTYADKQGSSFCKLCPENTYSNKEETSCHQCDADKYSGDVSEGRKGLEGDANKHREKQAVEKQAVLLVKSRPVILKTLAFWALEEPRQPTSYQSLRK